MMQLPTYREIIQDAIVQLVFLVVLSVGLLVFVVSLTDSYLIGFFSALLFIIGRRLLVGGKLKRKRQQVEHIFGNKFPFCDDHPFVESEACGWVKGVGYLGEMLQPLWYRVSENELLLLYLCRSRLGPMKISRKDIYKQEHVEIDGKDMISIKVRGIEEEIIIPNSPDMKTFSN